MVTLDRFFKASTINENSSKKIFQEYEIPPNWKILRFKDILDEVNVRVYQVSCSKDIEVYSLTKDRGLIPQTKRFKKQVAREDISKYKIVKRGWLVYNPFVIWEGAITVLLDEDIVAVSPVYLTWRPRNNVLPSFLYYLTKTKYLLNQFQRYASGAVNRRRSIKKNDFLNIEIPIPPIEEQIRIVYVLNTIRHAIEVQDRLLDILNELKRALMNRLFTKGLDPNQPTKQTEIGEIPAHWEVKKLLEISTITMGNSPPGKSYNVNGEGIPLINGPSEFGNMYPKKIKFTTKPTKLTRPGDILIAVRATVGKVNFADDVYCIGRGVAAIRVNKNIILPEYLYYFLQYSEEKIRLIAKPHGTTFPQITKSQLSQLRIPLPPFNEQNKISNILIKIDNRIKLTHRKKNLLEELFNVMLHKLMTGQIRVTNLDEIYSSKRLSGV